MHRHPGLWLIGVCSVVTACSGGIPETRKPAAPGTAEPAPSAEDATSRTTNGRKEVEVKTMTCLPLAGGPKVRCDTICQFPDGVTSIRYREEHGRAPQTVTMRKTGYNHPSWEEGGFTLSAHRNPADAQVGIAADEDGEGWTVELGSNTPGWPLSGGVEEADWEFFLPLAGSPPKCENPADTVTVTATFDPSVPRRRPEFEYKVVHGKKLTVGEQLYCISTADQPLAGVTTSHTYIAAEIALLADHEGASDCGAYIEDSVIEATKVGAEARGNSAVGLTRTILSAGEVGVHLPGAGHAFLDGVELTAKVAIRISGAGIVEAKNSVIRGKIEVSPTGEFRDLGGNTFHPAP